MSRTNSKRLRGIIYLRMSSSKQEGSIEQQRDWARKACEREQIEIVSEFVDEGRAGHETSKRTGFLDMLTFCQQQQAKSEAIDIIVCWAPSRFSRADSDETSYYRWQFRLAGLRWMLTKTHGIRDWEKGTDRLLGQVEQEASDHKYSIDLAGNVLRGKLSNARNGYWNGGRPPFGYRAVPVVMEGGEVQEEGGKKKRRYRMKLIPDEQNGPIVTELFRRFATGRESLNGLCRWLDNQGIRPARAKGPNEQWRQQVLRRILRSEKYLGDLLYGRERKGKFFCVVDDDVKVRTEADEEHSDGPNKPYRRPNTQAPLIDRDTFNTVQRLLEKNTGYGPKKSRDVFPLMGLLTCSECGYQMVAYVYQVRSGGKRSKLVGQTFFRCGKYADLGKHSGCHSNQIHERSLLDAILRKLKERLLNPEALERFRAILEQRARRGGKLGEETLRRLERELQQVEKDMDRADQRYLTEEDERLAARHRKTLLELTKRKDGIEQLLAEERLRLAEPDTNPEAVIKRALEIAERLDEALANVKPDRLRAVLLQLIERVEVFHRHEQRKQRERSFFSRAVVYLYPGLLADLLELDASEVTSEPNVRRNRRADTGAELDAEFRLRRLHAERQTRRHLQRQPRVAPRRCGRSGNDAMVARSARCLGQRAP